MMVKETLLRENAKFGSINRSAILEIFSLEKFIVNNIIEFLAKNGDIAYYWYHWSLFYDNSLIKFKDFLGQLKLAADLNC